jgi:hypothetical protein
MTLTWPQRHFWHPAAFIKVGAIFGSLNKFCSFDCHVGNVQACYDQVESEA